VRRFSVAVDEHEHAAFMTVSEGERHFVQSGCRFRGLDGELHRQPNAPGSERLLEHAEFLRLQLIEVLLQDILNLCAPSLRSPRGTSGTPITIGRVRNLNIDMIPGWALMTSKA